MPTIRASLAPMARKQLNGFATIFSLQFQNACTLNFFGRYIYIYRVKPRVELLIHEYINTDIALF